MVSHGLGVSIVPDRGRDVALPFPVRTMALPGPAVRRVVGLLRPQSHAKASLADALLDELVALADREHQARSRKTSRKLKK
jgi:DNA-binding transcriptional LysR family regulator